MNIEFDNMPREDLLGHKQRSSKYNVEITFDHSSDLLRKVESTSYPAIFDELKLRRNQHS